jgi:plastocyanin
MLLRPPRFEALSAFVLLAIFFATPALADVPVTMVGFEFSPRDLIVQAGETVTWFNPEGMFHTVTDGEGSLDPEAGVVFDTYFLGDIEQTFSYVFSDSGVYPYFCRFHEELNMVGTVTVTPVPSTGVGTPASLPSLSVSPNPMRDDATLEFQLEHSTDVTVSVYDVTGRRVRDLFRGPLPQGEQTFRWDGRDGDSKALPNGMYVMRLEHSGGTVSTRVALLR